MQSRRLVAPVVEYDAIVVGAGHNGLTTAAYLAKAGMRTLVLERYRTEGGMTITEEITLPGFRSDLHSYSHTFVLLSPALEELQLAKYGLEYVFPEPTFISLFPNGRSVYVSRQLDRTCKSIERFSRRDALAWRQLFEGYLAAKPFVLQLLLNPPPAFSALLAQLETLPDGLEVFRNFLLPVRQWCDENFEAEETKVLFGSWAIHASYAPDDAGGAIFTSLITAICQDRGNGLPKGGSMSLSKAIAACARAHGAKIVTNGRVRKILVRDGEADGVQLADGREFHARRAVISAVDPTQLFLNLVGEDHLDAGLVRKVRRIA
jgi:phytoene dehydrogenase-like protein